jgi:hypothetical protein
MKPAIIKTYLHKYGRKALIAYLIWCIIKGIAFIFLGYKLFN